MVLSRDSLFRGNYIQEQSAFHPDGDRLIIPQRLAFAAGSENGPADAERFIVVTNWFEELRQRMRN